VYSGPGTAGDRQFHDAGRPRPHTPLTGGHGLLSKSGKFLDIPRLDLGNRKKSSKSDWVFIEKLARLYSQLFDRVEAFLGRAIPPCLTIRIRL
jgi:hypothetical protein